MPLFDKVRLKQRYTISIMSTKGVSVIASRELVHAFCAAYGVPLFVLHDLHTSGFTIFGALRRSTRGFRYTNEFEVIDLGLRMGGIAGLQSERVVVKSPGKVRATLHRHCATREEIDVLAGPIHGASN